MEGAMKKHYALQELLEMHPDCPLNPQQVGYLVSLKVIRGRKIGRNTMIYYPSFIRVMEMITRNSNK